MGVAAYKRDSLKAPLPNRDRKGAGPPKGMQVMRNRRIASPSILLQSLLRMHMTLRMAMASSALLAAAYGQTPGDRSKTEFDVASIRVNPPRTGFRFATDTNGGAPDLTNPGLFRCSDCTLATLIRKAFDLQNYQFPERSSLGADTFDVMAKLPASATQDNVRAMLQNLLRDRFGLAYHFKDKTMRGYHLVIAKNGMKLKESPDKSPSSTDEPNRPRQNWSPDQHGQAQGHTHNGLVNFNGSATYRADHQSTADLAVLLSDQLSLPVDDQTALQGKYDILLNWAGNLGQSDGNHSGGGWGGGAGHGDHGGGPAGSSASSQSAARRAEPSGPTLFEALQSQIGLKLVPAEQAVARIFVIDHAEHLPTAN